MANLIVSRSGVSHAVDFANQLYLALMKKSLADALSDPTTHMGRESVDHREKASNRYVHPALWRSHNRVGQRKRRCIGAASF